MPQAVISEKSLAEAVAKLVDTLHYKFSGIKIRPIPKYEDEDFTFEMVIPKELALDEVESICQMECIKTEDEYDFFILPRVIYEQC